MDPLEVSQLKVGVNPPGVRLCSRILLLNVLLKSLQLTVNDTV